MRINKNVAINLTNGSPSPTANSNKKRKNIKESTSTNATNHNNSSSNNEETPIKKRKINLDKNEKLNTINTNKHDKNVKINKSTLSGKNAKSSNDNKDDSPVNTDSFRNKLIGNLKGSRFRFLNEMLYSSEGSDAVKLFKDDKGAFKAYHDGYRQQVEQWPLNPLDRIIKAIRKL